MQQTHNLEISDGEPESALLNVDQPAPILGGPTSVLRTYPALDELSGWHQWVVWQPESRNGKPTKVPYCVTSGDRASVTDPATWSDYDTAVAEYRNGGFSGVGFVLTPTDPYVGLDLDRCRDPKDGSIEPWALAIVRDLDSYCEVSPSGAGLRLFVRGVIPGTQRRKGQIEMYSDRHYLTVTGQHVAGAPTGIEDRQQELDKLHAKVFGHDTRVGRGHVPARMVSAPVDDEEPGNPRRFKRPEPLPLTDEQVLRRARSAANSEKFVQLYDDGDHGDYPSQSEADLALCGLLAFWTHGDVVQMDRLFRHSALMRPKWDEPRGAQTYGERTIRTALGRRYSPAERRVEARRAA